MSPPAEGSSAIRRIRGQATNQHALSGRHGSSMHMATFNISAWFKRG